MYAFYFIVIITLIILWASFIHFFPILGEMFLEFIDELKKDD